MVKALQDPEIRKKIGEASLKRWQDKDFREKTIRAIMKGSEVKPNKLELVVYSFLNSNFSGEFAINVKGNILILGGRTPDFVNINGQKKLIEANGTFWHSKRKTGRSREQEENQRINYFKKFGWDTLIIWENELKNEEKLVNRIKEFVRS